MVRALRIVFATLLGLVAVAIAADPVKVELEPLAYPYNGLEPVFSAEALEIHYARHHKTYADRFAQALQEAYETSPYLRNIVKQGHTAVLQQLQKFPAGLRSRLQNNGGGYVNHAFFWKCMRPARKDNAPTPGSALDRAIATTFGSFAEFKKRFYEVGLNVFGSGWAWLYADPVVGPGLFLMETPNQESPIQTGKVPLLTLDVWEHSYYLVYKNMRATYATDWWDVVNWPFVEAQYDKFLADYENGFTTPSNTCAAPASTTTSTPILVDNSARAPSAPVESSVHLNDPAPQPPRVV